jgi:hypothetical protein
MAKSARKNDVHTPIHTAPPEVQQIIYRVLELEKERLDKNDRGHINEDILKIIKDAVK